MENTLKIRYPFRPFVVTQSWGVYNPDYIPLGFSKHNGIDANVGRTGDINYRTQFPVYCPVEDFKVAEVKFYPKGGGNQIGLLSKKKHVIGGVECYASILMCHAKKILVKEGDEPKLGQVLMIGNNTGFSTGPHTHIGLYRLDDKLQKIDVNQATGSYNPYLCFTNTYAVDEATLNTLIGNGFTLAKYYMGTN